MGGKWGLDEVEGVPLGCLDASDNVFKEVEGVLQGGVRSGGKCWMGVNEARDLWAGENWE